MHNKQLMNETYLDKPCSTIKVKMQVLDLSILRKSFMQVILLSLFMYTGHQYDPALHSWCIYVKDSTYVAHTYTYLYIKPYNILILEVYIDQLHVAQTVATIELINTKLG